MLIAYYAFMKGYSARYSATLLPSVVVIYDILKSASSFGYAGVWSYRVGYGWVDVDTLYDKAYTRGYSYNEGGGSGLWNRGD